VALGLLAEGPTHRFALARELSPTGQVGQVWTIHRPLVYRAVGRLEELGLVEAVGSEPSATGPPRTTLRATADAERRVAEWLEAPVAHVRDVRSELLVKLVFLARAGRSSTGLLARQREALRPVREALEARRAVLEKAGADSPEGVVAAWRHHFAAAVDRLLDDMLAE
jgi:DNA-binding PadR family transcriptional regulator